MMTAAETIADIRGTVCEGCNGPKARDSWFCSACFRLVPDHMIPPDSQATGSTIGRWYGSARRCIAARRVPITAAQTGRKHRPRLDERWTLGRNK